MVTQTKSKNRDQNNLSDKSKVTSRKSQWLQKQSKNHAIQTNKQMAPRWSTRTYAGPGKVYIRNESLYSVHKLGGIWSQASWVRRGLNFGDGDFLCCGVPLSGKLVTGGCKYSFACWWCHIKVRQQLNIKYLIYSAISLSSSFNFW